jgi:hypothetical protein
MKKGTKAFAYISASVFGIAFLGIGGFWAFVKLSYYLPSDEQVLHQFQTRKADYVHFVELVKNDPSARYVDGDGRVDIGGVKWRDVTAYRQLIRNIGAKFVLISDDGSVQFVLWGNGCAICSDSFMGVLYLPLDRGAPHGGWQQTTVASLDSSKLPQENGSVATGLYVVPVEPKWFIYRFEYQE